MSVELKKKSRSRGIKRRTSKGDGDEPHGLCGFVVCLKKPVQAVESAEHLRALGLELDRLPNEGERCSVSGFAAPRKGDDGRAVEVREDVWRG